MEPERLQANLARVKDMVAAACDRAGRDPAEVRLVAVTKTVDAPTVACLHRLGLNRFGENRVPTGVEKAQTLADPGVEWHFIGHLQRNKADRAVTAFRWLHGVESPKLVRVLGDLAGKRGETYRVFVEVNVAGEASKYGVEPAATEGLVRQVLATPGLELMGLMTMAPYADDPEEARPVFRALRELRDRLRDATGAALPDLSMGMSNDFAVAIEEGATYVRVGSALFV